VKNQGESEKGRGQEEPKTGGTVGSRGLVEQMIKLLEEAEVEKALQLADEIEDKKEVAKALNDFGASIAMKTDYYDDAELILKKALELDPNNYMIHYNLGFLYTEPELLLKDINRIKDAEKEYRIAIKLNPDYADAHFNLALVLFFTNRVEEANLEYNKALKLSPDDPRPRRFIRKSRV